MAEKIPRVPHVRAAILEFLATRDGTHEMLVDGTGYCNSSVLKALRDLHAEHLIHIGSYTKKSSRHRYIRTYRMGPGTDATMKGLSTAMQQNAAAVLALLSYRDMTRSAITAALDWKVSNTWNVILHMRENNMIHVCAKIREPSGQNNVHLYRAGAGDDCLKLAPRPPKPRTPKVRKQLGPPPTDPLMAAFFGR